MNTLFVNRSIKQHIVLTRYRACARFISTTNRFRTSSRSLSSSLSLSSPSSSLLSNFDRKSSGLQHTNNNNNNNRILLRAIATTVTRIKFFPRHNKIGVEHANFRHFASKKKKSKKPSDKSSSSSSSSSSKKLSKDDNDKTKKVEKPDNVESTTTAASTTETASTPDTDEQSEQRKAPDFIDDMTDEEITPPPEPVLSHDEHSSSSDSSSTYDGVTMQAKVIYGAATLALIAWVVDEVRYGRSQPYEPHIPVEMGVHYSSRVVMTLTGYAYSLIERDLEVFREFGLLNTEVVNLWQRGTKAHIALRLVGNKGKLGYVYAFGEWDKANDDMENSEFDAWRVTDLVVDCLDGRMIDIALSPEEAQWSVARQSYVMRMNSDLKPDEPHIHMVAKRVFDDYCSRVTEVRQLEDHLKKLEQQQAREKK